MSNTVLRVLSGDGGPSIEPAGDAGDGLWRVRDALGRPETGAAFEAALEAWLAAGEPRGLVVGEALDAWGGLASEALRVRNRRLIERFRGQGRHTLHLVTRSGRVRGFVREAAPTPRVVLTWAINAPAVAEAFETGALQAGARLGDARACREAGWRVRVRVDPMIPVPSWQVHYTWLADVIAMLVQPERVALRAWRPTPGDAAWSQADPSLRALLEPAHDGTLRVRGRLEMYRLAWTALDGRVPGLEITGEDRALEHLLRMEIGTAPTLPPPRERS